MEQLTTTETANVRMVTGCAVAEFEDFDALVLAEQRRIYRVLLAMLRDSDAADSLTQECFLKAYEHRKRFRGECSMRTWLMRIPSATPLLFTFPKRRESRSGDYGLLVSTGVPGALLHSKKDPSYKTGLKPRSLRVKKSCEA